MNREQKEPKTRGHSVESRHLCRQMARAWMTPKKYLYTERQIEKKFIEMVKDAGGEAYKFVSPSRSGVPDRIVVLPDGRIYFIELKAHKGHTSALQRNEIYRLNQLGQNAQVLRGMLDVYEFALLEGLV